MSAITRSIITRSGGSVICGLRETNKRSSVKRSPLPLGPMFVNGIGFCYEWGRIDDNGHVAFPDENVRYHQVGADRGSLTSDLCASNERSSVKGSPLPLVPMFVNKIGFCYEWGRIHVSSHVAFPNENVRYHQVGADRGSLTSDLCASNKRSSVKRSPLPLVPMLVNGIGFCYEWGRIHVNGHVAFLDENVRNHQVGSDRCCVICGLRPSNKRSSVKSSPLPLVPMLVNGIGFCYEWGRIHVNGHVAFPDENVRYHQVGADRSSLNSDLCASNERSCVKSSPLPLVPMLIYVTGFCYEWGRIHVAFPDENVRYHQGGADRSSLTSDLCASNKRSSVKRSPLPLVPMLVNGIGFCYEWGRIHVNGHVAFLDEKVRYNHVGADRCSVICGLRATNKWSSVKSSPLPLVPMLVNGIGFCYEWGRIHVNGHVAFPDENVRYHQVGADRGSLTSDLCASNERSFCYEWGRIHVNGHVALPDEKVHYHQRQTLAPAARPMLVNGIGFCYEWGRIHVNGHVAFPDENVRYHQVGADRGSLTSDLCASNERSFCYEWGRIHVNGHVALPDEKVHYHQVGRQCNMRPSRHKQAE
ncbi:hypothetical protein GN958_ATG16523 [Phytophthora infestans]|uniref:Uncharacterized protein n=1 Tax=Phytophthora infestans TaxID=4787 RepID=A0A8S9TZT0_PHYIN|nr:hypothetical protein GN958_ATG16523 [Phytophthora infestans]